MRHNKQERDVIEVLTRKIEKLERRLTHLENPHSITVHSYAKASLPSPLVEGKIFLATDDDLCWVSGNTAYFVNGTAI